MESPCFNTWRFKNIRLLKHRDSKNFRILYTQILIKKANNSVKSQGMMKIFEGVNQGTAYYQFMKKTRLQKSHATVPLRECSKLSGGDSDCIYVQ